MQKLPKKEVLSVSRGFKYISFRLFFSFTKTKLWKRCPSHSSGGHNTNSYWETLGNALLTPGHVTLNLVGNILATEKFSPYWVKQSHFGKGANDQINSFMELSDLIKLLYRILKLIKAIEPFCKWFFPNVFTFTVLEGFWCQSK